MSTEARAADVRPIVGGLKRVAMAGTAGLLTGALVGGVGGRLAMLVLRLTSDPSVRGIESDDGFTIGVVSSETMFLVMFTAVLGAVGGLGYLVIRAWLPSPRRPALFAALMGVVGGALIIHPDGVDFTLLGPRWLAIVLFVALPAAYGLAVAFLIERWLRSADDASTRWLLALVPAVIPFVVLGPRGLPILVLVLLASLAADPRSIAARTVGSRPVVWLGRIGLATAGVAATVALVTDVAEIL